MSVVENIQNVRAKIAAAAEKSGRTAEDVLLLAADWRGGAGRVPFSGRKQGAGNHGKI